MQRAAVELIGRVVNLWEVAIGDVVGGSDPDLVVSGNSLSVLTGDGAGAFGEPIDSPFSAAGGEAEISIGDLSGDGLNDIVLGGLGGIDALLGDGTGFSDATGITVAQGAQVARLSTGDLNGDGKTDAVAKFSSYAALPFDCAVFVMNAD